VGWKGGKAENVKEKEKSKTKVIFKRQRPPQRPLPAACHGAAEQWEGGWLERKRAGPLLKTKRSNRKINPFSTPQH